MRYYSMPQYPFKHYYIKYKIWHKGKLDPEIVEFWTDEKEEYDEKLKFIALHHNYDKVKQRYPTRRG